jgi:hypothetical protein
MAKFALLSVRVGTRLAATAAVAALLVAGGMGMVSSASADTGSPAPGPTTDPAATSTATPSATATSTPAPDPAPTPSAAADTGQAPLTTAKTDDSAIPAGQPQIPVDLVQSGGGNYLPLVHVSINGSDPILMMIDTGTNFLVVFPDAIVNPTTPVDDSGVASFIDYNGTSAAGTIALAQVTVGGATTPEPIAFLNATSCAPSCLGAYLGIKGVIGIGTRLSTEASIDMYSPLAQMGGDLATGFTVDFASDHPVIAIGKPKDAGDNDTVLQRPQETRNYPNGQPIFLEPVICWTISTADASANQCNSTVFDTGQSTGMIVGDQWGSVVDPQVEPPDPGSGAQLQGFVKTGATVSFATDPQSDPFAGIVEPGVEPFVYGLFSGDVNNSTFNAGNGFYLHHTIGFNNDTGEVIIGEAKGTPTAPQTVDADAGIRSADVRWTPPAEPGDGPITGYVITATLADGKEVSAVHVHADARTATLDKLKGGTAYRISVAAVNEYGIGARLSAAKPITPKDADKHAELAATGAGPVDGTLVVAGILVLAGLGALSPRRMGRRRRA